MAALSTVTLLALLFQVLVAPVALAASLSVRPRIAFPDSAVTVSGSGFEEEEKVGLCWDQQGCSSLGTATTGDEGDFRVSVRIPGGASSGLHTIYACQDEAPCAQGTVLILGGGDATTTVPPTTTTQASTTSTLGPTTTIAPTTTLPPSTTTQPPSTTTTAVPPTTSPPSTVPDRTTTIAEATGSTSTTSTSEPTAGTTTTTVDDDLLASLGEGGPEVLSRSITPDSTGAERPDDEPTEEDSGDDDVPVALGDSDGGLLRGPAGMTAAWLGVMLLAVIVVLTVDGLRRRRSR